MITAVIFLIFLGSFFLYKTSSKNANSNDLTVEKWIAGNNGKAKAIGLVFFTLSVCLSAWHFGMASGIIYSIIVVIIVLGLIVVIAPLKLLSYKHLAVLFILFFLIEYIF